MHCFRDMESKIKLMGHPVHPMLVHFPIAFYVATLVAYATYAGTDNVFWFRLGIVANLAGVVSAAAAAIPGSLDWAMGIPDDRPAKAIGLQHMVLNVGALVLFAVDGYLQARQWNEPLPAAGLAITLSAVGVALTGAAGVLGSKLIDDEHVGVHLTAEQERIDLARQVHPGR